MNYLPPTFDTLKVFFVCKLYAFLAHIVDITEANEMGCNFTLRIEALVFVFEPDMRNPHRGNGCRFGRREPPFNEMKWFVTLTLDSRDQCFRIHIERVRQAANIIRIIDDF